MLRVLQPSFKPVVNDLICRKTGLVWVATRNNAIQLVLQQCCKTSCMFFVALFTIYLKI